MESRYFKGMLAASLFPALAANATNRPDVLIVYTDEHNFRTIEAYLPYLDPIARNVWGTEVPLSTPNLNFLAKNGVLMNHCFVTCPLSTPSRSSLMSGLYSQKTNCVSNDIAMDTSLKTLAQCFAENGYDTGYFGKWHLSGDAKPGWQPKPDYGWKDNFYMFNRGHYKSLKINGEGQHPDVEIGVLSDDSPYMTDFLTEKAVSFIRKNRTSPYLCLVSFPDPHGPNKVSTKYYDMYKDYVFETPVTAAKDAEQYPSWSVGNIKMKQDAMRNYWGMVKCIDDNIGVLINTLKEKGSLENTIIIFTSDHGDMCGEHGKENKGIPMEASLKVPFIVYAPSLLKGGHVVQEAVSNIDIYPTLVDMCSLKGMPKVDGVSIRPLLENRQGYQGRNCVFSRSSGNDFGWLAVSTDRYRLVLSTDKDSDPWLFDNVEDPLELKNFYTNPSYKKIVKELKKKLSEYGRTSNDPRFNNDWIQDQLN